MLKALFKRLFGRKYRLVADVDPFTNTIKYFSIESSRLGLDWWYVHDSVRFRREEAEVLLDVLRENADNPKPTRVVLENHHGLLIDSEYNSR